MKLTTEQRSEIISEMASSEAGFNELMRVLLDSFSKQEHALFLEEHKGEQGNGFRPRGNVRTLVLPIFVTAQVKWLDVRNVGTVNRHGAHAFFW